MISLGTLIYPFFSASWATSWPNRGDTSLRMRAEMSTTPEMIAGPVISDVAFRDFTRLAKAIAMRRISKRGLVM